ncbi:MAG: tRNA (N(6)-L-threonylcarbamoyladenosine(37)-C(2))-methylthiotransferase MtaB [Saprospiraceae bacterium]|nr:tRNA (N(6)-L-threonylcarbamoyladenosine(37)-C(2))-methylthiotransferase MtaB [Saprospiraceae bacterium]
MATPQSVAFYTLGCKLNYSETSSIGRLFEDAGFGVVSFDHVADIYVINTCSVTEFADRKCKKVVRQALSRNPSAFIVVIGCYAQLKPDEIALMDGVDLVLGAKEKFNILHYVEELSKSPTKGIIHAGQVKEANAFVSAFSYGDRTRSFLKVQDGCDYKCSFCTIPQARGKSRSDTIESVVANAMQIANMGVKEIVLTGVNIGDFGNGTEVIEGILPKKQAMFIDLIKELDNVEGISRFRISSIEPNLLTDEVIAFVANSKRFVPHFHIPLQSGSDRILRMMRRRYTRSLYTSRVAKIKELMPHACIGVDVIVGFPGETQEDFLESYRFIADMDVSYLHVFTYSERQNTDAAQMENQVALFERRERNEMLRILSEKKQNAFYSQFLHQTRDVLVEHHKEKHLLTGFTDNYIKVVFPFEESLVNTIQTVSLQAINDDMEITASKLNKQQIETFA